MIREECCVYFLLKYIIYFFCSFAFFALQLYTIARILHKVENVKTNFLVFYVSEISDNLKLYRKVADNFPKGKQVKIIVTTGFVSCFLKVTSSQISAWLIVTNHFMHKLYKKY